MALFQRLSASSSPQEIADAYEEFTGMAGGDNPANQKLAVDYLTSLGVATPAIEQAYSAYTAPPVVQAPIVQAPVSGLSAVTSGKNTVLEDTSNTYVPEVTYTPPVSTGALTQVTTPATNTAATTTATTGALDQVTAPATNNVAATIPAATTLNAAQKVELATNTAATTPATVAVQLQGQTYNVNATDVNNVKNQILAQGTTSKWTGEGFGSADANAEAMAKNLVASGVTDINQVAMIDKKVDAQVIPQYEQTVIGYDNEGNAIGDSKIVGYTDAKGNKIDPSLVKAETVYSGGESGGAETVYTAKVGTEKVIGNKVTGEALISDYDRSTGSA
jgi:hypothetical protein